MTSIISWFAAAVLAVALATVSTVGINCLTRDMTAMEVFGADLELDNS